MLPFPLLHHPFIFVFGLCFLVHIFTSSSCICLLCHLDKNDLLKIVILNIIFIAVRLWTNKKFVTFKYAVEFNLEEGDFKWQLDKALGCFSDKHRRYQNYCWFFVLASFSTFVKVAFESQSQAHAESARFAFRFQFWKICKFTRNIWFSHNFVKS